MITSDPSYFVVHKFAKLGVQILPIFLYIVTTNLILKITKMQLILKQDQYFYDPQTFHIQ